MRGLAIGDLHLGIEERFKFDTQILIEYLRSCIAKHAVAKGIKHVFFLGDVFDEARPSQRLQAHFNDLLHTFVDSGLIFYVQAGNHCVSGSSHSLTLLKQAQRFKEKPNLRVFIKPHTMSIEGVPFNFLPWPHSKGLANHVNVAHILKVGCVTDSGYTIKDEKTYSPLDDNYWIIGDNHTYQRHRNSLWVGTPYQTKFSESADCKLLEFEATLSGARLKVNFKTIDVTPPHLLQSHTVRTLKQAKELIANLQENPLLFVALRFDPKPGHESITSLAWPSSVLKKEFAPSTKADASPAPTKAKEKMDKNATLLSAVRAQLATKKRPPWEVARALTTLQKFLPR